MTSSNAVRVSAVGALVALIRVRSLSLVADMLALVQAIMRPLDPSVPSLREGCLQASTAALRELVKRYTMVAFHQPSQRLAVGTVAGVIIIYDLRTATKWRILQVWKDGSLLDNLPKWDNPCLGIVSTWPCFSPLHRGIHGQSPHLPFRRRGIYLLPFPSRSSSCGGGLQARMVSSGFSACKVRA